MLKWLFTPVHKTIRMTPLTCFTTLVCSVIGCVFTVISDDFLLGMMKAVFVATLIGFANMGVHEAYHKWGRKDERTTSQV